MRIISDSEQLKEFSLPLKIDGDASTAELAAFFKANQKTSRSILSRLSSSPEEKLVKKFIQAIQKQEGKFKFDESYASSDIYNDLVKNLFDYYFEDFDRPLTIAEKRNDLPLADSNLQAPVKTVLRRSKTLIKALDDLYFKPGKKNDKITFDLRRVFVLANNQALREVFNYKGVFTNTNDLHAAMTKFEQVGGLTPHYHMSVAEHYDETLEPFMPVKIEELDWKNKYLRALRKLFNLSENESKSIVKYLGLIDESKLKIEGFARPLYLKPYLNVSPKLLDLVVIPEIRDPDIESIPASTVMHEVTHCLLKDRYPEFFSPSVGDKLKKPLESLTVDMNTLDGKKTYPLKHMEELICFSLTMFVNQASTVIKLASINDFKAVPKTYDMAADYAKALLRKYKLRDPKNYTPETLNEVKQDAFEMTQRNLKFLDDLKRSLVISV